jgi:hypothetical protein
MKGCSGPTIFINRVEHMTTHLKLFQGNLHPEDFKDIANVNYNDYKLRANRKDLDFDLSKSFFNEKIKEPCYLCGKKVSMTHKNGLDRFDSDIGYIEKNINSCCGNCNMIKRDYKYDDFINKCKLICEKNLKPVPIQIKSKVIFKIKFKETQVNALANVVEVKSEKIVKEKAQQEQAQIVRGNKMTQDEKREKERLKKQKQREALREKYGDEEFRKMRAEEIARTRKKKKLNEE